MRRSVGAAILIGALAGGCAPTASVTIVAGRVDPEIIRAVAPEAPGSNCTLRKRGSVSLSLQSLPIVPALINGRSATLILDTGAESSLLTASAAKRLGVTTKYDFQRSMAGIGSSVHTGDARLDSMSLGGVALDYPRALVGQLSFKLPDAEPDGLLGASLLGDFDLDIDVPRRRLDLYDRLDCDTARPAWSGRYVTLETTRSLSEHPFFPITVNGRTLSATLDTGAQRTVISARAAAAAGIGAESRVAGPEIRTRGAAGETMPAALHALRDFRVGGIALRSPVLVVPASLPRDIDALLGLDFLMSNRVWLSYGSRRIFIQPGWWLLPGELEFAGAAVQPGPAAAGGVEPAVDDIAERRSGRQSSGRKAWRAGLAGRLQQRTPVGLDRAVDDDVSRRAAIAGLGMHRALRDGGEQVARILVCPIGRGTRHRHHPRTVEVPGAAPTAACGTVSAASRRCARFGVVAAGVTLQVSAELGRVVACGDRLPIDRIGVGCGAGLDGDRAVEEVKIAGDRRGGQPRLLVAAGAAASPSSPTWLNTRNTSTPAAGSR